MPPYCLQQSEKHNYIIQSAIKGQDMKNVKQFKWENYNGLIYNETAIYEKTETDMNKRQPLYYRLLVYLGSVHKEFDGIEHVTAVNAQPSPNPGQWHNSTT